MDIMELGAIGELVGGLAVVGSLIYVGYQIRQNSSLIEQSARVARGATVHATNDSYTAVYDLIAREPDLAEIYAKGLAGGELSETEVVRYEALMQFHFAWLEDIYHQQKLELMADRIPDEHLALAAGAPFYRRLLEAQYAKDWWRRDARYQYTQDFYADATRLLLGQEAPVATGHASPSHSVRELRP